MAETLKGALIRLDDFAPGDAYRGVVFQYNPEKLYRKIDQPSGPVPSETITCTIGFDATDDRAEFVGGDVYSTLSALELIAAPERRPQPGFWRRLFSRRSTAEPAITLFAYGPSRLVPVRITRLDITEELHDPQLRVLRATVTLVMSVLAERDVEPDSVAGDLGRRLLADKTNRAGVVYGEFPEDF